MALNPPRLDDRSFDDLVDEVLARIPAHTPDWTDVREGDPGRTLVELFAWLTDTLLYRANLVPERQRLAFLRLLDIPMRPARPARGLVSITMDKSRTTPLNIRSGASIPKPVYFETRTEMSLQPVVGEVYIKRKLTDREKLQFAQLLPQLQAIYGVSAAAAPYVTTLAFPGGIALKEGVDVVQDTVDQCLWLALLSVDENPKPGTVGALRKEMGDGKQLLHVGVAPAITVPPLDEQIGPRAQIPHAWEMCYARGDEPHDALFVSLEPVPDSDTTAGLTQKGTQRLKLPSIDFMAPPSMDVSTTLKAGVGEYPPRIDDPKKAGRIVAWLRLRLKHATSSLRLSWVGVNAAEIDACRTVTGLVIGQGNGAADQEFRLPAGSVEPKSLKIQVEEPDQGYQLWQRVDDLALAKRDEAAFWLDAEAGTIRTGDGVRGRVVPAGSRVRVQTMRAGGGAAGNLPPGALTEMRAEELDTKQPVSAKLTVLQPMRTEEGAEAETLAEAEKRIPELLRHGDRAVTPGDYKSLAAQTPGVSVKRVEVMPRFKPQQRLEDVPGVVSVMVLPSKDEPVAPNPRADRPFLEAVFAQLDARRPVSTELYVTGCEYIPVGVAAGIEVQEGYGRQQVVQDVLQALRRFLWTLPPGGIREEGWERGRSVNSQELQVVVSRVKGVLRVEGVSLFQRQDGRWKKVTPGKDGAEVPFRSWQFPELLSVVIDPEGQLPEDLRAGGSATLYGETDPQAPQEGASNVAIPVVPEVC